ncbi:MAG: CDP-alcohol phosphatidyltransferase family protein [Treponema sp.]|nr:CDP-alcohol phosphatidyltransferase family protein [Treponema sp.]
MLGVYDYTVILTYLSIISASIGIVFTFHPNGALVAIVCLMVCGLLDAFDGKVARTKKNRSDFERKFGIQIDSLSDVIAFGVLPSAIGANLVRFSRFINNLPPFYNFIKKVLFAMLFLYVLAAVIRLAYFNVTEEIRQESDEGNREFYTGVPVTTAAIIFPLIYLLQMANRLDLTLVYMFFISLTGLAFISEVKIKKPEFKHLLILIGLGILEVVIMVVIRLFLRHN